MRLPLASHIFHTEQYSLLMAHLASATEQSDCLVVVCGANGSGKTTLLNRYIASLSNDSSYATIDENCNGEKQFYCALLSQLGFNGITGTTRELRRIAKEFLVHRGMAGDPVLMMIDNAHLINPTVLEQLRWISAIKVKDRRVVSVVLAGNSDLARIMDSPAMSQTKFHSHVRFNIRAYSEDEIGNYISHRLKSAGATDELRFSSAVRALVSRYTGGIPSLINMLCNAVLIEAHARKSQDITEELVRAVADNRRLLPHVVPLQGKGRRKTDPDFKLVRPERQIEERITTRDLTTKEPVDLPTLRTEKSDVDVKNLLAQITQLSLELGELRANRMRALQDIGSRDLQIKTLREKHNEQCAKTEKLASALRDKSAENGRLNQILLDSELTVQKNEKTSIKLATDLEKARSEKKAAHIDCDNAKTKVKELSQLISELQAAVTGLTADLKIAEQRAGEASALESNTVALRDKIENKAGELLALRGELDSREEALASCTEKILALEAKNENLESRNIEVAKGEDISALGLELQEVSQMLTETRAQLTEYPTLNALPRTDACDSPKPQKQQAESSLASEPDSTTAITAFEVVKDGEIQQVMEVAKSQSRIMIGRAEDSELSLDSGFVSRHHALIFCTEQGVYIEDLNSFNGTIVNSRKTTRCDLRAGDVVEIGDFQILSKSSAH